MVFGRPPFRNVQQIAHCQSFLVFLALDRFLRLRLKQAEDV